MSENLGPTPEDMGMSIEAEGKEPTNEDFLNALQELKEHLDEDTFESLVECFSEAKTTEELDEACGYLVTVAIDNDLVTKVNDLLIKHQLSKENYIA